MIDLFRTLGSSPSRLKQDLHRDTGAMRRAARGARLRAVGARLPDSLTGGALVALLGEQLRGMLPEDDPAAPALVPEQMPRRGWGAPSDALFRPAGGDAGPGDAPARPGGLVDGTPPGNGARATASARWLAGESVPTGGSGGIAGGASGNGHRPAAWTDRGAAPEGARGGAESPPDLGQVPAGWKPNPADSPSPLVRLVHAYFDGARARPAAAVAPPAGVRGVRGTNPGEAVPAHADWTPGPAESSAGSAPVTGTPDDAPPDRAAWSAPGDSAAHAARPARAASPGPVSAPDPDELAEALAQILRLQGAQHGIDMP